MNSPPNSTGPDLGKALVRRLIDDVMNQRRLEVLDEIYSPAMAVRSRAWIAPFLDSFTDVEMRIVELVAEADRVVGRFSCSGTHIGTWRGHAPTHKRFTNVAEVYIFRIRDGRIASAWGLEDTWERMRQLGLLPTELQDET
jgi:predicted ester cyclase